MNASRWRVAALAAMALAVLVAGCGGSRTLPTVATSGTDTAVDPAFGSGFYDPPAPLKDPMGGALASTYPLATGNRWHYRRTFTVYDPDGLAPPYVYEAEIERVQTCPVMVAGRDYLTERHRELGPDNIYLSWIRYRQNQRGLFEADISTLEPSCETLEEGETAGADRAFAAARESWAAGLARVTDAQRRQAFARAADALLAKLDRFHAAMRPGPEALDRVFDPPGGPPEGELMRLRYPLMPGQKWVIRNEPRFQATVETSEVLDLPAGRLQGWRIRYDSEFYGPRDLVRVWYGPQGFLKIEARLESVAYDAQGQPIGALVAEERQVLDAYALVDLGKRVAGGGAAAVLP